MKNDTPKTQQLPDADRMAILAAEDLPTVAVDVPEWGRRVHVRMMTASERDDFELAHLESKGNIRARLAVYTLCDKAGVALFHPDDLEALAAKSGAALDRIFEAAMRLNRLSKRDVEDLEKN